MGNDSSLKHSFALLVIKVVVSTTISFLIIILLWLAWLSAFPRNYYDKIYSESFLSSLEEEIPSLLSGDDFSLENKDSKFQYLITINNDEQIKSDAFPEKGIKLNESSNATHSFIEKNTMYSFKVFDSYPNIKVFMIYPAFSTGNQSIDYINVVFQYFIVASPFVIFIIFLSLFTTNLYKMMHSKFKIVETHLKEIEEGNLTIPLPEFSDREFGELSRQVNKMRLELKDLWDDSQRKALIQKQLFSSIAHDVKTPLTIINAEAELLDLLSDDANVQERCAVIAYEVSKIDGLLTELLKITQLNTDRYTVKYEKIDINNLLHRTLFEFSSLFKAKGVKIKESYSHSSKILYCDPFILTRVIQNVLSNAIEHVNVQGEIICSVHDSPLETILSISNTGSLFSEQYLNGAFTPFYSEKSHREKEHFGLGLYMSDLMIKKMNGFLSIKNENQRATVVLTLKNT